MSVKKMFTLSFLILCTLPIYAAKAAPAQKPTLRILSDRTQTHLTPLFESFKEETGIEIQSLFVDKGLLARLEASPKEADLVITKDADLMEIAKKKKLIAPFQSPKLLKSVPQEFRDPENFYFSDSYRSRTIFYSKDRIKTTELNSYRDLAEAKWKGRICIRSGYDDYNVNLFAQWILAYGEQDAKKIILGLHQNLAKAPAGNDREQIRNILEKKCDLAIANSYYMGIMLNSKDQKEWGQSSLVFFPDQKEKGAFVLKSGLALTTKKENQKSALKFLEYMMTLKSQEYTAKATFAYPVMSGIPLQAENQNLGVGQPEVKNGVYKINNQSLKDIASLRGKVIQYLDEIQFDRVNK